MAAADATCEAGLGLAAIDALVWSIPLRNVDGASALKGRRLVDAAGAILQLDQCATGLTGDVRFEDVHFRKHVYRLTETTVNWVNNKLPYIRLLAHYKMSSHQIYCGPPPELYGFATHNDVKRSTNTVANALPSIPMDVANMIAAYIAFAGRGLRLRFAADGNGSPHCSWQLYGRLFADPPLSDPCVRES